MVFINEFIKVLVVCFFLSLFGGCVSTTKLSQKPVLRDSSQALVYVIRPDMYHGFIYGQKASVDGKEIAKLANNSFSYFYAEPGVYKLEANSRNMAKIPDASAHIRVVGGQTHYFMIDFEMGVIKNSLYLPNQFTPLEIPTVVPQEAIWIELPTSYGAMITDGMKCSLPYSEQPFTSSVATLNVAPTTTPFQSNTVMEKDSSAVYSGGARSTVDMGAYYEEQLRREDLSPALKQHYEKKLAETQLPGLSQ